MMKLRRLRWSGCVERKGKKRNAYRILVRKPEGRDHYEDVHLGGNIILKWRLEK
jgi:hypothetical protein